MARIARAAEGVKMDAQQKAVETLDKLVSLQEQLQPTEQEIAEWRADKDAATAARNAHAAHMDRAEKRSVEHLSLLERQTEALERIAPVKLQPLQGCGGCKWRVDSGRTRVWNDPNSGAHYECHRYPPVMPRTEDGYGAEYRPSANGLGCGERQ